MGFYGPWIAGYGPFSWLAGLIELALLVVGLMAGYRILSRMGFNGWWVLLAVVPIANVVGLWMLSQAVWPGEARPPSRTAPAGS
jgi:hypothetical protein